MSEWITVFVSLALMALFSAAETSFVSADKIALIVNPRPGIKPRSVLYFLQNNEIFFATVVVASNLFITLFSSVAEMLLHSTMGIPLAAVVALTALLGFVLGELVPKSIAVESPEATAKYLLPLVRWFAVVMKPVVRVTARGSSFIARTIFRSVAPSSSLMFQRRDVYRFLGSTVSGGYLDKIESDMIRRLLSNANVPVKNIAVPRTHIVAAKLGTSIEKVREVFEKTKKTKVVIYDSSIDNVVGVVYAKDIFREVERVDELLSDILFVPENITVIDLLEEFRSEKVYLAVLIDEFGGTAGLVTSSDVMELFLGEVVIWGSEERVKQVGPRQYIVKGSCEISEVERASGIRLPAGEFATVAGLIVHTLGRIPSAGDIVMIGRLEFQILQSDGRKIDALKITVK